MNLCAFTLIFIVLVVYDDTSVRAEKMDAAGLLSFTKPMRNSCIKKTNVNPTLVDNVRAKNEFADDPKLKCFFRCISIMLKIMNKQFEITYPAIKAQVETLMKDELANRLLAVTKQCVDETEMTDDSCRNAFELTRCIKMKDNEMYFIP